MSMTSKRVALGALYRGQMKWARRIARRWFERRERRRPRREQGAKE
jgi:hypothetical protein